MAFVVKFKNERATEFHQNKPPRAMIDNIVWFSADGDELTIVRNQFMGIPITRGNFCRWTGEMAEFLFGNLRLDGQWQKTEEMQ